MNHDEPNIFPTTSSDKIYQVENHCFIVHRQFSSSQTAAQILAAEISSSILQQDKLNSQAGNDIIKP